MDRNNIIKKLRKFLQNHSIFTEECEVIYLMVEIRKILDRDRNNLFEVLRFYCNWALHVYLDKELTTQYISKMFDRYIDITKTAKEIARDIKSAHPDFFKLNDLKSKLTRFLKIHSLPLNLVSGRCWSSFVILLLGIIADCPVVCIKSSNKIKEMKLIIKDNNKSYGYQFNLIHGGRSPVIILKFK